jgi:hypothetical protein
MCTEGRPCSHCRKVLQEGNEPVGVAGLFNDDPEHIALVPTESSDEDEDQVADGTGN